MMTDWAFKMGYVLKTEKKDDLYCKDNTLDSFDKSVLRISKLVKSIKKLVLERISDIYLNCYEFDFDNTTEELLNILQSRMSMFSAESSTKVGSLLKIFTTWSECEVYKYYFLKYPYIMEKVVSILHEDRAKTNVTNIVFQIIRNLQLFDVQDDLVEQFYNTNNNKRDLDINTKKTFINKVEQFKDLIIDDTEDLLSKPYLVHNDTKVSFIGAYIIFTNVPVFLTGFQRYMENSFANYQNNQSSQINKTFKDTNTTKISVTNKGIAKLNSNVLETSLMISQYIDTSSQDTVESYLQFLAPFLDPTKINKRTDKLQSK